MDDFNSMIRAHTRIRPSWDLAVSGWTLGPGPETFPPGDGGWLNAQLPANVSIGAMNVECGHAPPDPAFARLPDHTTFTIPWMEVGGHHTAPFNDPRRLKITDYSDIQQLHVALLLSRMMVGRMSLSFG
eukprot:SAG31_NODE_1008_length_10407_cov_2.369131_6_plen_129_part_00